MRLGLLLLGGLLSGTALPFWFHTPAEALWHAPWTALFGLFAAALAFRSYDHAERHHLDDDPSPANEP